MRSICGTEAVSRILKKNVVTGVVTLMIWLYFVANLSPPSSTSLYLRLTETRTPLSWRTTEILLGGGTLRWLRWTLERP